MARYKIVFKKRIKKTGLGEEGSAVWSLMGSALALYH